ncbi:MAG: DUF2752 domain-containing protein [Bacteroidales bacterium]|nr:DUF2752 domain-containing protein [Bacteroidales bacterium]
MIIIAVAVCLVVLYGIADPQQSAWFPKCPFKWLTGYSCPGCGSQRLIHAMLQLRFAEAFRYNALLFVSIPYLILLCYSSFSRVRHQRLYMALNGQLGIAIPFVVIILWWVVRNILGI